MTIKSHQKGNVLFIILITIALFAALSYAVSSGMRGGGETISKQQASVSAGDILRSMQSVRTGYEFLMSQGCSIDDIAFDYPALTNLKCQIFNSKGAGVSYPQNLAQNQVSPDGTNAGKFLFVTNIAVTNVGTSTAERMIVFNYVDSEVCKELNKALNYSFSAVPTADATPTYGDTVTEFAGRTAGCHGTSQPQIWFTLLEL